MDMNNANKNLTIFLVIIVIIVIGVFVYISQQKPVIPKENIPIVSQDSIKGCYVAKLSKDVYTLNIKSENNGVVSGVLAYNNYEKDSSSGSFNGTFKDNILLGTYSFDSEGMHSDNQLIFKKVGNSFVQGFGPTKIIDGKETFENISAINFDSNSTFIKNESCVENFTSANNIFSLSYNSFFKLYDGKNSGTKDWRLDAKQDGILLARITIPRTYMPNTNFSDANLTIGVSTNPQAIKSCASDMSNGEINGGVKTISGYPFSKLLLSGAGAGNLYETTSYRGLLDGDCYVLEYTIHSTNIGNYPPEQGVKEFDKNKIQNELETIINSFKFLVNSD